MRYKVGDKVRVKPLEYCITQRHLGPSFPVEMDHLAGNVYRIDEITPLGYYSFRNYFFMEKWLLPEQMTPMDRVMEELNGDF